MHSISSYVDSHLERFVEDLIAWLRIPSVSSDPKYSQDVLQAADHIAKVLASLGFQCEVLPTKGHPSLYAERIENREWPTLLVYGHLDVQPVDPLDQWKHPPFEPWRENGNLYGRGAADDKGQTLIHIQACRYWIETTGKLPVNIKFIIEGEEEIGSPNFEELVSRYRGKLASDVIVVSDTAMAAKNCPTISYATRGLVYFEVIASGPRLDLHSGSFGGAVANPAMALVKILSQMVDGKGKVAIPGFYKNVIPLTRQEKQWISKVRFLASDLKRIAGVSCAGGEQNLPVLERVWGRPTFEVHGLSGGFQGPGSKTIIPQQAMAKVSMRLVPKQNPASVARAFERFVKKIVPKGVRVTVRQIPGGGPAFLEDVTHPAFGAAKKALQAAFGRPPVLTRCGGSIFAPELFKKAFPYTPTLLMGFGLPDENAHAPNERLDLDNFKRGIETCARFYELLRN